MDCTINNEINNKLPIIKDELIFSNIHLLSYTIITDDFDSILEEYSCKICFELIYKKEPLQCIEGHVACKNCFEKHLSTKKECMHCRTTINSIHQLGRVRFIEESLSKKKIKCPYSFKIESFNEDLSTIDKCNFESIFKDTNGCGEIIKIGELESHLNYCNSRFMKCSNNINGCEEVIRYKNLNYHISNCGYSIINCSYCQVQLKRNQLNSHNNTCPEIEIQCNQCSDYIKRGEMDNHIESKCPNTTIKCDYYEYGCSVQFKRCELDNHYEQINHTKYMTKLIQNQSKQLIESNVRNNHLNNIINHLNDKINHLKDNENTKYIKWNIKRYSELVNTDFVSSRFDFNDNILFLSQSGPRFNLYSDKKMDNINAKLEVVNLYDSKNNIHLDYKSEMKEDNIGFRLGCFYFQGKLNRTNEFISQDVDKTLTIHLTVMKQTNVIN